MSTTAALGLTNDYAGADQLPAANMNLLANSIEYAFNGMLSKDVGGAVDVTLSTSTEARNGILYLNGVLTASINVILPAWMKCWLVINATSGSFTLTIKTASGSGVAITQGYSGAVRGDGTDILRHGPENNGSTTRLSTTILAGPVSSPVAAVQNLASTNTITLPTGGKHKRLSASGGAVTGIILTAGTVDGQELALFNLETTNTITFATAATSNVADGVSAVIAALRCVRFLWDSTSSRWYRSG